MDEALVRRLQRAVEVAFQTNIQRLHVVGLEHAVVKRKRPYALGVYAGSCPNRDRLARFRAVAL
jgi:hypothetical protein